MNFGARGVGRVGLVWGKGERRWLMVGTREFFFIFLERPCG
jgi:hypothetical protein